MIVNFCKLIYRFSIISVKAHELFLLIILLTPNSCPNNLIVKGSVP